MDAHLGSDNDAVPFRSPKIFFSDLDPSAMAKVVASAADVALIIQDGIIKDIALGNADLSREGYDTAWRGKRWIETVTVESRPKIEALLKTVPSAKPHWRQVNHPSARGQDVPIRYTAVRAGENQRLVAIGRDLRSLSALQQRLVEAHQGLEREYDRLREAEARYRLLFQTVAEPVFVVDALTGVIEEANPAAARALGRGAETLIGEGIDTQFPKKSQREIELAIAESRSGGAVVTGAITRRGGEACRLSLSPFPVQNKTKLIVRMLDESAGPAAPTGHDAAFLSVMQRLPDGLVIAGPDLVVIEANKAFADMARIAGSRQAVGRRLVEFLGRSSTELNVLVSSLKNHGSVRNFSTILKDHYGAEDRVEVSAVVASAGGADLYGFSIRNVARRLEAGPKIGKELPSSVDQLTGLVGKVSLKEIVRDSTDLIERLCIEAALEITEDNRASAAEMLGLSRQGLYSKLKRFGFDE